MHWLAQAPVVNAGVVYTCPISASAGGGRRGDRLSISYGMGPGIEVDMSTQKILVPGQSMDIGLSVRNSGFGKQELRIFTIFDNQIHEKQLSLDGKGSGSLGFDLTAPQNPGKYTLTAFSSSGDMLEEEITVISARQIRITEIALPGSVELEETKTINVTLMNFGDATSGVIRIAIGDHEDSRTVAMGANSSKNVGFPYSPKTAGEKTVSITLLDSDGAYQDAWVGHLAVSQAPSFKESVSSMLEDFISWLSESIRSLFGL
jgi:hypothetical protein